MFDLNNNIYNEIVNNKSVLLVGKTDSGKTWYALNSLIPFLNQKDIKAKYFSNPDFKFEGIDATYIVDEFETLFDKKFLEERSGEGELYYSVEYLSKVKTWHDNLKNISFPMILILTRNNQDEINYIIENMKTTDWGLEVKCFEFHRL